MPRISLRYKQIILAIVLLMTSVSCGVSASPEVQPDENGSVDPELILGREIWGIHCSSCHGASGQGGRGIKLNNFYNIQTLNSLKEISNYVDNKISFKIIKFINENEKKIYKLNLDKKFFNLNIFSILESK